MMADMLGLVLHGTKMMLLQKVDIHIGKRRFDKHENSASHHEAV